MADIPGIPPAAPPSPTRRDCITKITEHNNEVINIDAQIAKGDNLAYFVVYDSVNNYSNHIKCNSPETKNALKAFLKALKDINENKCQEYLLKASEAEKA